MKRIFNLICVIFIAGCQVNIPDANFNTQANTQANTQINQGPIASPESPQTTNTIIEGETTSTASPSVSPTPTVIPSSPAPSLMPSPSQTPAIALSQEFNGKLFSISYPDDWNLESITVSDALSGIIFRIKKTQGDNSMVAYVAQEAPSMTPFQAVAKLSSSPGFQMTANSSDYLDGVPAEDVAGFLTNSQGVSIFGSLEACLNDNSLWILEADATASTTQDFVKQGYSEVSAMVRSWKWK